MTALAAVLVAHLPVMTRVTIQSQGRSVLHVVRLAADTWCCMPSGEEYKASSPAPIIHSAFLEHSAPLTLSISHTCVSKLRALSRDGESSGH